ncbi:MAG: hypothetical protein H0W76_20365 [Pyrinomonadaceae bacterium]|nr:hypothetical protein [Pyrinomonadaceae bacterium]
MMRKPKYRLQPVLDVRDRAKQESARHVAMRRAQFAAAEAELTRRQQAVAECRAEQVRARLRMVEQSKDGIKANKMVQHRTYCAGLKEKEQHLNGEVERQRAVVRQAEEDFEQAIVAFVEASRAVQVIEKHRESWRERTRREDVRQEQRINDEIGSIMHTRRASEK